MKTGKMRFMRRTRAYIMPILRGQSAASTITGTARSCVLIRRNRCMTYYCSIHLTDMVFLDTDDDSSKEIVFGTKYNQVYVLNAQNGVKKWMANVGREVTVLTTYTDPYTGAEMLLVGTESGDVFLYDRTGQRIRSISLYEKITAIKPLPDTGHGRTDIIVATSDGRLVVCNDRFIIQGSYTTGISSVKGIVIRGWSAGTHTFLCRVRQ